MHMQLASHSNAFPPHPSRAFAKGWGSRTALASATRPGFAGYGLQPVRHPPPFFEKQPTQRRGVQTPPSKALGHNPVHHGKDPFPKADLNEAAAAADASACG
jgi:hypothetical protein